MLRDMWFYMRVAALKLHVSPVFLFLAVHTALWCDASWVICQLSCAVFDISTVLHALDILVITAYGGIFGGIIGGVIYLMHEELV